MSAFVEPPLAWSVFGTNLFEELSLEETFKSLYVGISSEVTNDCQEGPEQQEQRQEVQRSRSYTDGRGGKGGGGGGVKPFECIGTPDEVKDAVHLAAQRYKHYQRDTIRDQIDSVDSYSNNNEDRVTEEEVYLPPILRNLLRLIGLDEETNEFSYNSSSSCKATLLKSSSLLLRQVENCQHMIPEWFLHANLDCYFAASSA
mmetsp:Transcript_41168/g.67044  ORF Transcript_41168/g.67044 Transcript_41168/m.67044 type:complete len:201 (+) Transcript_41168:126-728(+)